MYKCDYLRHHHLQGPKTQHSVSSQYEDPLQTNGDIPVHVLYNVTTNSSNKAFKENNTTFKKAQGAAGID